MKTTAAFGSLAATSSIAALTKSPLVLYLALGLVAVILAIEVSFFVLYVRRPADRKDLLRYHRAWRGR
jgi:hypothetical protein